MDLIVQDQFATSAYQSTHFASRFDRFRPAPPSAVIDAICGLVSSPPIRVLDLGSGTGLSTAAWSGQSKLEIGLEQFIAMRSVAARHQQSGVAFVGGSAYQIPLAGESLDVVTCSQALHWMDPVLTFPQVARVLHRGGVFAAYDYDWPPKIPASLELALQQYRDATKIVQGRQYQNQPRWPKGGHLERLQASGYFEPVGEIILEHTELGSAERLIGHLSSLGGIGRLIEQGYPEVIQGIAALRQVALEQLGSDTISAMGLNQLDVRHVSYKAPVPYQYPHNLPADSG
jgi:SAM-dependent methyltransferase